MSGPEQQEAGLDDLRRRLYRADVTDADLQRYLELRGAAALEEPLPPAAAPRRRLALVVAAAITGAALVGSVLLVRQGAVPPEAAVAGPATVSPAEAAVGAQRFQGVGDALLAVQLPGAEFSTRNAVVAVFSDRPTTIAWRALRRSTEPTGSAAGSVMARERVRSQIESAIPTTFSYAGAPPSSIAVDAPAGVRWTVLVAPGGTAASSG